MRLYHVTKIERPLQTELVPCIPEKSLPNEENKTKRISLSDTLLGCLQGLGITNDSEDDEFNIRLYSFEIEPNNINLISWDKLYNDGYVDDAELTHEYWYTDIIKPDKVELYHISDFEYISYNIISNIHKDKLVKIIIDLKKYTGDLNNMSAFQLMNEWLSNQDYETQTIIKNEMQDEVIDYDESDVQIQKKLFGDEPIQKSHKEPYYRESLYLDNFKFNKINLELKYIFLECRYAEINKYREEFDLPSIWYTVDKDVWKNDECLYKILDLKKNIVAFFYFSISDDVYTIHLFDVVPKYSKSEIGKEIINQFMIERNIKVQKIRFSSKRMNLDFFDKNT